MKYDQFVKLVESRVKDSESITKLDVIYGEWDSRCWTAVVDGNIVVTYHINRGDLKRDCFDVQTSKRNYMDISLNEVLDIIGE